MELFNREDINTFLNQKHNELTVDIQNIPDKDILSFDMEEFKNYYYDKYYIVPIYILNNQITNNIEKTKIEKYNFFYGAFSYGLEQKTFLVDGYKINYNIPFEGNSHLFYLQPTMRIMTTFDVDGVINENSKEYLPSIQFSINIDAKDLESKDNPQECIDKKFDDEFKDYRTMIEYVNNGINGYNSGLKERITKLLEDKYNKSSNFSNLLNKLNIPLKKNPNMPSSTPIALKVQSKVSKYPQKRNIANTDYCISNEDYENIKKIINSASISFEKAPKTINVHNEEEIRDFILAFLNTNYDSLATGETFSKMGKTDIRIQFENKAAFIAECKIWHGISEFNKAIEQLFSYTTWRDVKTSLIIFNKEVKDFKSILAKIKEDLSNHELCIACNEINLNNWQCTFRKCSNSDEKIEINIIVCDITTF